MQRRYWRILTCLIISVLISSAAILVYAASNRHRGEGQEVISHLATLRNALAQVSQVLDRRLGGNEPERVDSDARGKASSILVNDTALPHQAKAAAGEGLGTSGASLTNGGEDTGCKIFLYGEKHAAKFFGPTWLAETIHQAESCRWTVQFPRCRFEKKYNRSAPPAVVIILAGTPKLGAKLRQELRALMPRRPKLLGVFYSEAYPDSSETAYDFHVSLSKGAEVRLHMSCADLGRLSGLPVYGSQLAEQAFRRPHRTAAFISNCASPFRNDFVSKFMRVSRVQQFGSCFNNVKAPEWAKKTNRDWGKGKVKMLQKFKFSLAVENQASDSFVSEKLYHALEGGTVPIYFGAKDVQSFAPPASFIDARSFRTVASLAAHVDRLAQNATAFASYFRWSGADVSELMRRLGCHDSWLCRACQVVASKTRNASRLSLPPRLPPS